MEYFTTSNYDIAKAYRGARRGRDKIAEFVVAPKCVICEKSLERKTMRNGYPEPLSNWFRRKTCGKYMDENGFWVRTDCFIKYISGEGNPNYKGIMPRCKVCGKNLAYYNPGEHKKAEYCAKHWKKHAKETGFFKKSGQRLIGQGFGWKNGQPASGVPFKKGHKTWIKGKTYEEVYGKTKSKKLKKILAKTIKHNLETGVIDCTKEKVKTYCEVCGKEMLLLPSRAKTRKTCSLNCNGKKAMAIVWNKKFTPHPNSLLPSNQPN